MNLTTNEPVLFDITRLIWRRWVGRRPTGIDRACLAYLEHFARQARAVVQHPRMRHIFSRTASDRLFDLLLQPPTDFRTRLVGVLARHGWLPSSPGRGLLYFNIGHTGLDAPGYRRWIRQSGVRPIYLVHDLIPITHPEFCRIGERQRHAKRMTTVLETGAGIVTNSRSTLEALREFARDQRTCCPPSLAALLGTAPLARGARGKAPPERPTFVTLGTIEGRKNHLLLLTLWSQLVARFGDRAPRLFVIGQRGWEAEQVFDLLDRSDALRGHVVEINQCGDDELAAHVSSARALLFPSLAEGFGLPLVEALSLGTPVIASDLPVFREIAGNIPDYLDPLDGSGWEAAIVDYARPDSGARAAQIDRMAGYEAPSWQAHFHAIDSWAQTL